MVYMMIPNQTAQQNEQQSQNLDLLLMNHPYFCSLLTHITWLLNERQNEEAELIEPVATETVSAENDVSDDDCSMIALTGDEGLNDDCSMIALDGKRASHPEQYTYNPSGKKVRRYFFETAEATAPENEHQINQSVQLN